MGLRKGAFVVEGRFPMTLGTQDILLAIIAAALVLIFLFGIDVA